MTLVHPERPARRLMARGLTALLLVAGTARADLWTTYQHDAQHTGLSGADFDPTQLTKVWSAPFGYSLPLVVNDTVYSMANQQGTTATTGVSSFRLSDGTVNWTDHYDLGFPSQP